MKIFELGTDTKIDSTPPTTVRKKEEKSSQEHLKGDKVPSKADKGGKSPFIELKPKLKQNDRFSEGLQESNRPLTQVDYLIRIGLGNPDRITWYRQVIKDPARAMTNPMLRPYIAEVLNKLLTLIFDDSQLYNRLRSILQKQDYPRGREREPMEELVLDEDEMIENRFHIKYHDGVRDKELVVQGANKDDAVGRLKRRNKVASVSAVKPVHEESWGHDYYAVHGGDHTGHKYKVAQEGGPHKSYVTARAKAIQHSHIHGGETTHVYRSDGEDLHHASSHRVGHGKIDDGQSRIHLFSLEGSGLGEALVDEDSAHHYHIIQNDTKTVVGSAKTSRAASRSVDKRDNAYGAYKYHAVAAKADCGHTKCSQREKAVAEDLGGGFVGTDALVDRYGKATPGEHDLLSRIKAQLKKGKD